MIRLSYIIPVYNVEQYLPQCLDSIFGQSLSEESYEVICVNDCSPDKSADILCQYQLQHDNMHVVTFKTNKGLSAARNAGVECAKGEYIWFVDSDDFIADNVASSLLEQAETDDSDVLLFNYCECDFDGIIVNNPHVFCNHKVSNGIDFVKDVFGDSFVWNIGYVWRYILNREYVVKHNLRFPEGEIWEDTVYFPQSILEAQRVASVDTLGYYYRQSPNSITNGRSKNLPAQKIYDYCFKTGMNVLKFATTIDDTELSLQFRIFAINHYINSIWNKLLKTSPSESKKIYSIINSNPHLMSEVNGYLSTISKLTVMYGRVSHLFLLFLRSLYKIKICLKK